MLLEYNITQPERWFWSSTRGVGVLKRSQTKQLQKALNFPVQELFYVETGEFEIPSFAPEKTDAKRTRTIITEAIKKLIKRSEVLIQKWSEQLWKRLG